MPFLLEFCQKSYPDRFQEVSALACSPENAAALITSLKSPWVKKMLDEIVAQRSEENVNFKFWWNYMEMVSVLLMFTRAQREGIWDLYLHSFRQMLPYFLQIWPSELCKMGISVHWRDGAVAKGSLRRVQKGELRCQMEWKQVQPGQSRSQPWIAERDREKR